MDVDKAAVVEEAVDGLRRQRAHAEGALEEVGARTQVLYGAQIFQRVALFLQGIIAGALASTVRAVALSSKGCFISGVGTISPSASMAAPTPIFFVTSR